MEIKTMEQLCEYINAHDEWKMEVHDIIAANGWEDLTGTEWGVCKDNNGNRVMFNSFGRAEVFRGD